jgi:hypothetical protein
MVMTLAIALGFAVIAFLAVALPSMWMRRRHGVVQPADTRELSREVTTRIGLLHGLILGLVFGQVMQQALELRSAMREEAAAVEHAYYRAARYPAPAVQAAARTYLDAVLQEDWPRQYREGKVSDAGWRAWRALLDASLALEPTNRREQALADSILQQVWAIEQQRQLRGFEARTLLPFEFWFAAIAGLVLIGGVLFVHEPSRKHHLIVGAYSVYAGLVLFMIYDLSRPFGGFVTIQPEAFEQALHSIRSGL